MKTLFLTLTAISALFAVSCSCHGGNQSTTEKKTCPRKAGLSAPSYVAPISVAK